MRHDGYLHLAASLSGLSEPVAEWWLGDTWKSILEFQQTSLGWRRDMSFGVDLLSYYVEFWHARHDPNVLVLCYEDLVSNRTKWVPVIADFMGVEVSQHLVAQVVKMTSKEFMLAHVDKFDGSGYSRLINAQGNIAVKWEGSAKVTQANYSDLTAASLELLQKQWAQQVEPSTGLPTYAAMRAAWRAEAFSQTRS